MSLGPSIEESYGVPIPVLVGLGIMVGGVIAQYVIDPAESAWGPIEQAAIGIAVIMWLGFAAVRLIRWLDG